MQRDVVRIGTVSTYTLSLVLGGLVVKYFAERGLIIADSDTLRIFMASGSALFSQLMGRPLEPIVYEMNSELKDKGAL